MVMQEMNWIKILDDESDNRELTELELEEMRSLNLELGETIKFRESIWRQKSRMTWLKDRDSNTAFFHRAVKIKAKRKFVHGMKTGNSWYSEPKELKKKMFNFFRDHFSYPSKKWKMDMVLKFNRLKEVEALKLEVPFCMEEIKEAVWSCDENKAPARAAVLINGTVTNEFKIYIGLRQGDPLSPFLFILVTKVLHLMMDKAEEIGIIEGIKDVIPGQSVTHLQFENDTILFLRADEEVVRNTKYILGCFEIFSGLSINFCKSRIVGFGIEEEFMYRMAAVCKCKIGELLFNCLRVPLEANLRKISSWNGIVERV
ncbi:hypothetical protein CXB51_029692 [Gossypium anomalum]|uniref:Reverse transcriptase domain-containing protein n=1 Tax=Gossypium anomalum TaxID=47600 RepID=A0A8J5YG42_9ROSI|nr:hypothetical protein CXB51_029692 [Gossypium anomalum]